MRENEPAYRIDEWRAQIPILDSFIPLNNCSQAPQMAATRRAADDYLTSWDRDGMDWETWIGEVEQARAAFARLINASTDEVSVTTSVSEATSSLASALDFGGERRRIAVSGAEFPGVAHVWLAQRNNGAEIDRVPVENGIIETAAYESVVDERTLLVSACHAYYLNGYKQDIGKLADLAHEHGALLYVDAYQTLGTCKVDVQALGVDMLSSGTLKFLLGVPGIAFLYIRKEHIEKLRPDVTGWFGRENPFAFDSGQLDWSSTARRFDTGTPPVFGAYVSRAGIDVIEQIGADAIHNWTLVLSERLIRGGEARGLQIHGVTDPERKTCTTAFLCPGDAHLAERRLRERGILASARGSVVRLAPHFYNTLDEIDTALDAVTEVFDELSDS